jgi:16S rRNA processing protein RimM
MAYTANILLGKISKTHGFEGAVTVKLEKTFIEDIPEMESVFIDIEGKPVPFFIEESEYPGGDILRLKFKWYNTAGMVNEFVGFRVFLTEGEKEDTGDEKNALQSFSICLSDNTIIGTIKEVIENPGQLLLNISTPDNKEILIPFHEDFIRSIDKKKKIIRMDLPEGLLEINQNP